MVPVLAYLLGMPARKRPTADNTVTARRILLDGLTRDADIFDLAGELAPLHPRNNGLEPQHALAFGSSTRSPLV